MTLSSIDLVVGCHVPVVGAVEVALPGLERVEAHRVGDLLEHPLADDHALGPAEAAKGGVGDGVGLQRQGAQLDRGQPVAIVGVEQAAVGDRAGEVRRPAAAGGEGHVEALDQALLVEADLVVDDEVVALAGDDHVVVAVGPALGGASRPLGDEGAQAGEQVALGLLAAEGAAHAADLDGHRVRGDAQHLGDHVLDLGRVLRRRIDGDLVVLAGDRQGDLPLEIEVLLPADPHPAGQAPGRRGDGGLGVAAAQGQGIGDQHAGRQGGVHVEDRRQFLVLDHRELDGTPRLLARRGGDGEDRLAHELDEIGREQRLVVAVGRADVVLAGDVGGGQHADDAVGRADRGQVDLDDPGMRLGRQAELDVEQPGGVGQIVDVERLAGDVAARAVVGARIVDRTLDALRHGPGSGRRRGGSPPCRWSRDAGGAGGCGRPRADRRPRRACR